MKKKFDFFSPSTIVIAALCSVMSFEVAMAQFAACVTDVAAMFSCLGKDPIAPIARIAFALITLFIALDEKDKIFSGESASAVVKALVKIAIPAVIAYSWTEIMTYFGTLMQ
jgi:hypothetical protein